MGNTNEPTSHPGQLRDVAVQYHKAGLKVFPATRDKSPIHGFLWQDWTPVAAPETVAKWDWNSAWGLAADCAACGHLVIIDFDHEADRIFPEFQEKTRTMNADLYAKLVIEQSPSGGFHVAFRSPGLMDIAKLATRTVEIQDAKLVEETYVEKKTGQAKTRTVYAKVPLGPKGKLYQPKSHKETGKVVVVLTLVETKTDGGYCLIHPSPNYNMVQGDWLNITTLTQEEADLLVGIAKSFDVPYPEQTASMIDEFADEPPLQPGTTPRARDDGKTPAGKPADDGKLTPWDDWNQRAGNEVVNILEAHGWSVCGQGAKNNTYLARQEHQFRGMERNRLLQLHQLGRRLRAEQGLQRLERLQDPRVRRGQEGGGEEAAGDGLRRPKLEAGAQGRAAERARAVLRRRERVPGPGEIHQGWRQAVLPPVQLLGEDNRGDRPGRRRGAVVRVQDRRAARQRRPARPLRGRGR